MTYSWLFFALGTVVTWGLYGILLAALGGFMVTVFKPGSSGPANPVPITLQSDVADVSATKESP